MKDFVPFFLMELKQLNHRRNVIILFILWLFLLGLTYDGIVKYKNLVDREQKFVEIEALNMKKFPNYDVYGDEGISVQYCPGPTGIFFDSIGVSPDLIGKIDSIVNISIFDNYKGKSLFRGIFAGIWSFAGIILFFGSILCLLWGSSSIVSTDYLKLLSSIVSKKKVYFSLIFSRLILISLIMLFFAISAFILLFINNIEIPAGDFKNLSLYLLSTLLFLFFFFLCGLTIGIIRLRTGKGDTPAILLTWIIFVFLIPGIVQKIVENKASCSVKDYQTEIEKFKIVSDFEKSCLEKAGKYNDEKYDKFREFAENYWKNYYPKIQAIEKRLKDEIKGNTDRFNGLSLLIPSTIYYLNSMEVSSRGYESYKDFYSYLIDLKSKFVRFYFDRFYYNDPKVMVNFIKDDENLFHAESKLPGNYWTGIVINLAYIAVLLIMSFFLFKNSLYKIRREDIEKLGEVDLRMDSGKLFVRLVRRKRLINLLFNLFSGNLKTIKQKGFTGKVVVNGIDIASERNREDFIFICHPDSLPEDMKVRDLIHLYTRLLPIETKAEKELKDEVIQPLMGKIAAELTKAQKFQVILSLLNFKTKQIYLIDDVCEGLEDIYALRLKERMDDLVDHGALVIYINNSIAEAEELDHSIYEGDAWMYLVGTLKRRKEYFKNRESLNKVPD